jgi:hypothetical protein
MVFCVPSSGASRIHPLDAAGRELFRVTAGVGQPGRLLVAISNASPIVRCHAPKTFEFGSAARITYGFSMT